MNLFVPLFVAPEWVVLCILGMKIAMATITVPLGIFF
jgi:hypothetical protein